MCGIAGVRTFAGTSIPAPLIHQMTEALHHRGPDASGTWQQPGFAAGHRRLAIIDLGGSAQPMVSTDGRHVLVFNGEILNYRQLRPGLDYPFTTGGDTEVLLAGLVRRGRSFLDTARGQFAFALFDVFTGSVLLGRDATGILPLYYYCDRDRLVFGSEVKALLPALADVGVDEASLDSYLARSAVPAPNTLFAGISKVLPGHTLEVSAAGEMRSRPYWSPSATSAEVFSPYRAVNLVEQSLLGAVRSALVADVPVGAYLSGGLDSSLITAMVRRLDREAKIETFSAGFEDPRFDELPFARQVADQLRTLHHEVIVRPRDFIELWPRLTWHRDAPLSQPADIAVFRLAQLARTRVKVVLSGEGSDELFAGYNKYRYLRLVEASAGMLRDQRGWGYEKLRDRVPRKVEIVLRAAAAGDPQARREAWFAPFSVREREALLMGTCTSRPLPWEFTGDAVRRQLEHDMRTWLPDNLLERGDRMSMAASLELRPPFLDRDLVDLAFSIPSSLKVRRGRTKWLVKKVGERYLPDTIVNRPKAGFRVPMDAWFRHGLRSMARDMLLAKGSYASTVFDRGAVEALLERHESGVRNEETRIWTLLGLEVWHGQFFAR